MIHQRVYIVVHRHFKCDWKCEEIFQMKRERLLTSPRIKLIYILLKTI